MLVEHKNFIKLFLIVVVFVVGGILLLNNYFYRSEKVPGLADDTFLDVEVRPLFYFSYNLGSTTVVNCPDTKDIDWDIAIIALSYYFEYGAGSSSPTDFGPAAIQRNFEENCERDMSIYTDVVTRNPHLLKKDK